MAKHLRSVFVHAFGKSWLDVGRKDTELNILLSSPIFRHANDAEAAELRRKTDAACLDYQPIAPKANGTEQNQLAENPTLRAIKEHQAAEETLFDVPQLLLLGALYCKGSRVGKSSLLFPLITRDESGIQSPSPLKQQVSHHLSR